MKQPQVKATAFAPAHVTGFFKIYKNGSTGAGFNLAEGVTTTVILAPAKKQKTQIYINGKKNRAQTSRSVIKKYFSTAKKKVSIKVLHKTRLPIGYGLGASGAGAFSLSLALNKALNTGFSYKKAMRIAAMAEIENGTGLGDVTAQQFHGVIRGLPPFPSKKAANIHSAKKYCVCAFFGPIKTATIIRDKNWKKRVNQAGSYCMKEISKRPSLKNFELLSRHFSVESRLATKNVLRVMKKIPNTAQAMLGSTAFALTNQPKKTAKKLEKFSKKILVSAIARQGARVL